MGHRRKRAHAVKYPKFEREGLTLIATAFSYEQSSEAGPEYEKKLGNGNRASCPAPVAIMQPIREDGRLAPFLGLLRICFSHNTNHSMWQCKAWFCYHCVQSGKHAAASRAAKPIHIVGRRKSSTGTRPRAHHVDTSGYDHTASTPRMISGSSWA